MATSAVATSASSIVGLLAAAGRPREKDHAVGIPRDVLKGAHHPGLAPSGRAIERHGRPQTGIELPPKLLDETHFVLGKLDVAFCDQHLSMSWLHPQKAHRRDYVTPSTST